MNQKLDFDSMENRFLELDKRLRNASTSVVSNFNQVENKINSVELPDISQRIEIFRQSQIGNLERMRNQDMTKMSRNKLSQLTSCISYSPNLSGQISIKNELNLYKKINYIELTSFLNEIKMINLPADYQLIETSLITSQVSHDYFKIMFLLLFKILFSPRRCFTT